MNDDTLILDLVRAGVSPDLVTRVAALIVSAERLRNSAECTERRRAKDRDRKDKKNKKLKALPEANDAGTDPRNSAELDRRDCNFLSSLSNEEGIREEKKEPRSVSVAQAKKGTRLSSDSKISDEDREYARAHGFEDKRIDRLWAEFVDYWSAVPGHRGLKLNWSATWRNRVRAIEDRSNGTVQGNSLKRALGQLADSIGEDRRSQETGPAPPRLLSHR